jgi:hypothetical protein
MPEILFAGAVGRSLILGTVQCVCDVENRTKFSKKERRRFLKERGMPSNSVLRINMKVPDFT